MNSERNYLYAVIAAFIACSLVALRALHQALGQAVIYW
jgi:Flp pilus assembly pilin Flp